MQVSVANGVSQGQPQRPVPLPPTLFKMKKNKFTAAEDKLLTELVNKFTETRPINYKLTLSDDMWEQIAKMIPNRNARQCHDRWCFYLSPTVKKTPWTEEEEQQLIHLINTIGPHWVTISKQMPGRTDTQIKNRWNVIKRRNEVDKKSVQKYNITLPNVNLNRPDEGFGTSPSPTIFNHNQAQQISYKLPIPQIHSTGYNPVVSFDEPIQDFENDNHHYNFFDHSFDAFDNFDMFE